ncbi:MAG TPA: UbiX family flavin prenyltransferase [Bryocella sp.]|nr:UbiX family flavin prenyltransferase [Bryocella sp.]
MDKSLQIVTLAVTGASGSILALEMLRALAADERVGRIHLIISPSALRVLVEETGIAARNSLIEKLLGDTCEDRTKQKIVQHAHEDIGAPIASGSYPCDAMIVLPCSMGTLAGIAHGMAANLVERAADVSLKEKRRLVLCVRETPLNLIHIRNMAAVAEAGATVFPVIPTFYNQPKTTDDMARNFVHRVLQHVGLPQDDAFVWGADAQF